VIGMLNMILHRKSPFTNIRNAYTCRIDCLFCISSKEVNYEISKKFNQTYYCDILRNYLDYGLFRKANTKIMAENILVRYFLDY